MLSLARRNLSLVVVMTLLAPTTGATLAPAVAHAQPRKPASVRDTLPDDAKKQWDTALALAQRNQWDGARAAFLQAYEISKNPRVLFNVAVSEKNLGRYPQAIELFRRELAEGKDHLTVAEQSEIEAAITGLEKYVMEISIEVSEAGAKVFVDQDDVGTSPIQKPITVAIGSHVVRASKAGFADAQERVTGDRRNPRVSLKLEPIMKTSRVNVSVVGPSHAVVKIDGKEVGPAPYSGQVLVSPEPHQFAAEAPGYVTATQTAMVREGEALNLTLQLSEEQKKGKLIVSAAPAGATIVIDGDPVGATRWEGPVDVGSHQIVVRKPGFYTWSYDVDVPKGGERQVTAQLNEDRNTSFVPWLVGTILVVGASAAAVYFVTRPKDEERVNGTLPPFTVGTPSVRW
jgi:hypothetical protein